MSYKGIFRKAGIALDGTNINFGSNQIIGDLIPGGVPSPMTRLFVDKLISSSGSGGSWSTAYKTIAEAITVTNAAIDWSASPWAPRYEIHIAPGSYSENLTSLPYGVTMIGHGDCWDADGENGVRIKPASGDPVDVGACINMKCVNIGFEAPGATAVFDAAVLNNVQFYHCRFAGAPEATTATAGIYTNDSVMLTVRDCRFEYLDCGIDFVYADGGDSCTRLLVTDNYFTYISEAGIRWSANLVVPAVTVTRNVIHGGGQTLAIGIDNNSGSDIVGVWGNYINATDDIQGVAVNVGGNYIGGSSIE